MILALLLNPENSPRLQLIMLRTVSLSAQHHAAAYSSMDMIAPRRWEVTKGTLRIGTNRRVCNGDGDNPHTT